MANDVEKCKYCNSSEGYYTKERVSGTVIIIYRFDGEEADNGDMYDGVRYHGGKIAYCINCDKKLFRIEE